MFTRAQWASDLLATLGNTSPVQDVLDFVIGWTTAETSANSGALFNLLNTTQPAPDASQFNSVGVRNYTSYQEGLQETAITLENGYYAALLTALRANDATALSGPNPAILANLNTWCGQCHYGAGFIALGGAHRNDEFDYGNAPEEGGQPVLQNYSNQSADFSKYFSQINDNQWQCKKTGNIVQFGIKSFYETLSLDGQSLPVVGLPTTNELYETVKGQAVVVQFYERAVIVYDGNHVLDSQPGTTTAYLAKFDDPFIASIDPLRK